MHVYDLTGVSLLVGLMIETFTVRQVALKLEKACSDNQHAFILFAYLTLLVS
jgi:hypothetical protein